MSSALTALIEKFERDYGVKIQYGVRAGRDCLCSVTMRRGKFFSKVDNLDLPLEESELGKILYDLYSRLLNVEREELNKRR